MNRKCKCAVAVLFLIGNFVLSGLNVQAAKPSVCSKNEWEVLRLTNEKRLANGLEAVSTFGDLQDACDTRAKEISSYFDHTRPDGTSCFSTLEEIYWKTVGENIAAGQSTPRAAVTSWWNSPGHKANMLGEQYDHMGVGYYYKSKSDYKRHWVQLFVGGCNIKKIYVNGCSKVTEYKKGTRIYDMKRYLVVECEEHGKAYIPLSAKMCKGYNKEKKGIQTIKVKYKGITTSFDVKIS